MVEISNSPVPEKFRDKLLSVVKSEDILFAVVGDLNLDGKYAESLAVFLKDRVITFDECLDSEYKVTKYADIEKAKIKRLYGNAIFKIKFKNGRYEALLRFSYAAAEVADAGANFINVTNQDGYKQDELEVVKAVYNKQRSFCPKCGRKLPKPNAECINCESKGKIISKFAKYISPEKGSLVFCMILSVITTAMSLVPPYITKTLVDSVIPEHNRNGLLQIILLLVAVYVIQYAVNGLRSYKLRLTGDKIIMNIKKDIYAKAQYLPMSFYDKISTGSVINRVNSDSAVIQNFVMKISQEAIVQAFTLIGLVVIMLSLNWKLTLFSLVPIPLVVIVAKFFTQIIKPKYMRLWRRGSAISTILADTIPGVRIVKAFTNEKSATRKFDAYCDEWYHEDKKVAAPAAIFPSVITFLVTCGSLVIWFVGGEMVIGGKSDITLGLLVSFISYASMFYNPVNFFANIGDTYQNTLASAEKILDILDAEPEHNFGEGNTEPRLDGRIEFRNVNFAFDRSKKVLSNINLTIEPGDIVGIVGTTGSGKSTLINLLMRYYDEYDGEILVDGENIRNIDMNYYRNSIGFVQQEPMMFRDTIFNNIAYGSNHTKVEQVLYAAEVANAHGFISKMPDAYDTMLGERGVGLSGGEKQRVSIARAVLKNPSILIFDEATAAVDSETESLIQSAIERLISGRTTLMIAHRLSTLRKANKIVVVDKGEIVECGTPDELMALKGKYYKLIEIQSMGDLLRKKKEEENFE
ncbi:MAG: ABC transporter ATP-binding protein [Acutalibacteraceae bacterium]|nr:ABC transporter ATP-binding protein [Acutalibacteraceae bacterium]